MEQRLCEKYEQSDGAKYEDVSDKCKAGKIRTEITDFLPNTNTITTTTAQDLQA
jgi:hypothetical protein